VRWGAAKTAKQRDYDLSGIFHPYVHASQAGESLAPRRMGSSPSLLVKDGHAGGLAAVAKVADPDGVAGAVASGGAGVSQGPPSTDGRPLLPRAAAGMPAAGRAGGGGVDGPGTLRGFLVVGVFVFPIASLYCY
jgi:hypothetical protein